MLGAFGAHSLKKILTPKSLDVFQTATHYLTIHSLALILVGILLMNASETDHQRIKRAGKFFIAGILLFCGSLYALTFDGPRFLGPVTPLGGLSFMTGWFLLAFSIKGK